MYQKITMFRRMAPGPGKSEMVSIGYWQPEVGPAIVKDFTYVDEAGRTTTFHNSNVIGQTLENVVRSQKGCGFSK